jgi:hypothetical protein
VSVSAHHHLSAGAVVTASLGGATGLDYFVIHINDFGSSLDLFVQGADAERFAGQLEAAAAVLRAKAPAEVAP